jgi:4-hydroxybenzoate polyprenyltransferase
MKTARLILTEARPAQWVKNVFVLAPLLFSKHLMEPTHIALAAVATALFCLISSAVYLLNDVLDVEQDRKHFANRTRPVASGDLTVATALNASGVLFVIATAGSMSISVPFGCVVLGYFLMNVAYSAGLKRLVFVDVMVVAAGFVLRVVGGCLALDVEISPWIIVCTFLLSTFLALCKRRHELVTAGEEAENIRDALAGYTLDYLDHLISMFGGITILAYCLYSISPAVAEKFNVNYMLMSVPPVIFGVTRYMYLVHERRYHGNPTNVVLNDRPFQINLLVWVAIVAGVLYKS